MLKTKSMMKTGGEISRKSAYERYKKTTRAIRDGLAKLIPSNMRLVSVSDLVVAAEHALKTTSKKNNLSEKRLTIHQSLLENLDETITLRETVGKTYADEKDDGHCHIIQVLRYCRVVPLNRGRYGVLGDDDNVEEEDKENLGDELRFERPLKPVNKDYTIEKDLIVGSLAFQANLFFLSAENLFLIVADSYEMLKQRMDDLEQSDLGFQEVNHKTVVYLMQATVAVNLALENVRYLEKSFYMETDYLTSIYHVFAVLVFQKKIAELEAIVGPEILAKNPALCVYFAGICVRFGFLGQFWYLGPSLENIICKEIFTQKDIKPKLSGIQLDKLKEIGIAISASADVEGCVDPEDYGTATKATLHFTKKDGTVARTVDVSTPQWLKTYGKLGGKSGIMHTFAQLEKFMIVPWKRYDSETECEPKSTLQSTREILNTTFRNDVLPDLVKLRQTGLMELLPGVASRMDFSACVPFLREFNDLMETREVDTPFSAAFGVHALVYGIFLLQGDDHCKRLTVLSKLTAGKFNAQVMEAADSEYSSFLQLANCSALEGTQAVNDVLSYSQADFCSQFFWNPLIAGSFLVAFF